MKNDTFQFIKKMSPLKKALSVFLLLLLFVIIVEQPGSDSSKREKRAKFFLPRLIVEEVNRIEITNPFTKSDVLLNNLEGTWRILNGRSFNADPNFVEDFLKAVHSTKEKLLVSRNPERTAAFSIQDEVATRVQMWDINDKLVADFYSGLAAPMPEQYLRRYGSDEVYSVNQNLNLFLMQNADTWKDKTLLSVDESVILRIAMKRGEEELVFEKETGTGIWYVIQPEEYQADDLAIRTLFEQIKTVNASGFADAVDGSQADFENPDYKLSIRLNDDSLKLVLVSKVVDSETEEEKYYAKTGDVDVVYAVSKDLVDSIFGLEFKTESEG